MLEKIVSLAWLSPQAIEAVLWMWVLAGAALITERLLLFASHFRFLPGRGPAFPPRHLRAEPSEERIEWFINHDVKGYQGLFKVYGEVAASLGFLGTLVSLWKSQQFSAGTPDLRPVFATAIKTTVIGIGAGLVVSLVFGTLIWPRLRSLLEAQLARMCAGLRLQPELQAFSEKLADGMGAEEAPSSSGSEPKDRDIHHDEQVDASADD